MSQFILSLFCVSVVELCVVVALHGNASGVGEFVAEEIVAFIVVFRMNTQKAGEGVGEPCC